MVAARGSVTSRQDKAGLGRDSVAKWAGAELTPGRQSGTFIPLNPRDGGWGRVGVPGWLPLDLTLDSSDLTRLNGFDAPEAGGRERQQLRPPKPRGFLQGPPAASKGTYITPIYPSKSVARIAQILA
jgi:hypothetical protein